MMSDEERKKKMEEIEFLLRDDDFEDFNLDKVANKADEERTDYPQEWADSWDVDELDEKFTNHYRGELIRPQRDGTYRLNTPGLSSDKKKVKVSRTPTNGSS